MQDTDKAPGPRRVGVVNNSTDIYYLAAVMSEVSNKHTHILLSEILFVAHISASIEYINYEFCSP